MHKNAVTIYKNTVTVHIFNFSYDANSIEFNKIISHMSNHIRTLVQYAHDFNTVWLYAINNEMRGRWKLQIAFADVINVEAKFRLLGQELQC